MNERKQLNKLKKYHARANECLTRKEAQKLIKKATEAAMKLEVIRKYK